MSWLNCKDCREVDGDVVVCNAHSTGGRGAAVLDRFGTTGNVVSVTANAPYRYTIRFNDGTYTTLSTQDFTFVPSPITVVLDAEVVSAVVDALEFATGYDMNERNRNNLEDAIRVLTEAATPEGGTK